jgi:2-keto-4-pentenoate hydratase/2-oxohepta-3-ene-1,7-dioic acid hydratase in catechol pathway
LAARRGVPAGFAGLDSDIKGVLVNWPVAFPALQDYAAACTGGGVPQSAAIAASQADIALPIQYPNKLVAIGANYEDHLREMNALIPKSAHPVMFIKPPTTALCGPGKVRIPDGCTQFDWEDEQLSSISQFVTLEPGDVVLTGSPAGVGLPRGEFLKPGDKVIATAEGVGELHMEIA